MWNMLIWPGSNWHNFTEIIGKLARWPPAPPFSFFYLFIFSCGQSNSQFTVLNMFLLVYLIVHLLSIWRTFVFPFLFIFNFLHFYFWSSVVNDLVEEENSIVCCIGRDVCVCTSHANSLISVYFLNQNTWKQFACFSFWMNYSYRVYTYI